MRNEEWVETSQEIIDHYNPNGVGKAGFFHYQGIKVCLQGTKEDIKRHNQRPIEQINHPGDAKVNGPTSSGKPQYVGGHGST